MTTPAPETTAKLREPDYGLRASRFQIVARYGGVVAVVIGRMLSERGMMSSVNWEMRAGAAVMWAGVGFFLLSAALFLRRRFGPVLLRDAILNSIPWRGDEQVLDVGCERGLMLIGAAKRLTTGHVVGIDLRSQGDQRNHIGAAAKENACSEGVADRVEIQDADARKLPFVDNSFDVVLSNFAMQQTYGSQEGDAAIREMARVLKPGGTLAIADPHHTSEYEKNLQSLGWEQIHVSRPNFLLPSRARVLWAMKPNGHA
jgi:arsenite methyltransferase